MGERAVNCVFYLSCREGVVRFQKAAAVVAAANNIWVSLSIKHFKASEVTISTLWHDQRCRGLAWSLNN